MSIKRIALSFVLFILSAFVLTVNTADAEETNNTNENEIVSNEQNIPDQVMTAQAESVDTTSPTLDAASTDKEQTVEAAKDSSDSEEKADEESDSSNKKKSAKASKSKKSEKSSKKSKKNTKKKYSKADLRLLATIIYAEANGESYAGKLAVGIIVMNRKESKGFANTVKGVIYQRGQFSPTWNGSLNRALARYDSGKFTSKAEKQCVKAAKEALSGGKTLTVNGKKKNFKGFYFFSGYIRGARFKLGCHMFK